mmetsp:Transcript_8013/g.29319  ORF Transcript_8013/g.29319 Transcript_8013/m.29319 type:complete len:277 (+) Transcript_8013:1365-2195(+)
MRSLLLAFFSWVGGGVGGHAMNHQSASFASSRLPEHPPGFRPERFPRERALDVLLHPLLERVPGRVPPQHLPVPPHQKLGVVPRDLPLERRLLQKRVHGRDRRRRRDVVDQRRGEIRVRVVLERFVRRRVHALAPRGLVLDGDLVHHRELEPELSVRVLSLHLARPGGLAAELVRGERDQPEPVRVVLLVQRPEGWVVRVLQGSLRRDVQDDGDVVRERAERERLAVLHDGVVVEARFDRLRGESALRRRAAEREEERGGGEDRFASGDVVDDDNR